MNRKVLMIVGDYGEDLEIYFPFQALNLLGFQVDAVCPERKKQDKVKTAVHDFRDGDQTYMESRGHDFMLNAEFPVDPNQYVGLVLPGGRAPEYLRLHEEVLAIVEHFLKEKKPIVAVCHGIQLLTAVGGIEGKKLTCYPACKFEVTKQGGIYEKVGYDEVVVDGNIVTSPAWPGHANAFREFVKLLGVTITHK
ncbi:unnamed protein product [Paramecium sonneborni]|uniref:DJ-1/PfpI domain-containing protein n=1 Tax=Paramecium sonneborni TaxID=65129 RepID=A0A8S1R3R6_9CILI|nr:unnamed protein product [Paramecium sonneborni]